MKNIRTWVKKNPLVKVIIRNKRKRTRTRELYKKLRCKTPVIVFQMGKVASRSIFESVSRYYKGLVLHAHFFSKEHHDEKVRFFIKRYDGGTPVKVISLVRDPISRNIAAFFQNLEKETTTQYMGHNFEIDELRNIFLKTFDHEVPLNWFQTNMETNFGIDVYHYPFQISNGYQIIESNMVELLLMRYDLPNKIKTEVIKNFLGLDEFDIVNTNIGSEKYYASLYKKFKMIKLPATYLDKMKKSKYFNHFYSKNEINQIVKQYNNDQ